MLISVVMKQRSTTPVTSGFLTKFALVAAAVLMTIATPLALMPKASARDYQGEINALQSLSDQYKEQAGILNQQANTLAGELNKIANDKAVIQNQIKISQAKFDQLQQEIAITQQKIANNKDALGATLADMYVDDSITPIEMIASSNNIGDYVDKESYRSSINDQLTATIETIRILKAQLEGQKLETERVLGDQKNAERALSEKEAEQQRILDETKGQEAAYEKLRADTEGKKATLYKEQQEIINRSQMRGGSVINLPGDPNKGNYPWGGNGCYVAPNLYSYGGVNGDGTDPLGYACRQCTSYAAWKVLEKTGREYTYWGNARQWPGSADASGVSYGRTPRAQSVGVIMAGDYGHVVWIEAVNGDGTVDISQFNSLNDGGPGWGNYSEKRVSAGTYDYYIYF